MSAYFFIQTLIYICTEKVTHTIHLKKDTSLGHIYKGPPHLSKSSCAKHISLYKSKQKKGLLTNTLAISPFKPIWTRRTHERAQSVIAETGRTHSPILTFIDIYIDTSRNEQTDSKSYTSSWYPSSQWRVCMCQLWSFDRRSVVMDGCYCCPTVRRTGNHRLRCRKAHFVLHLSATPLLMKLLKEKHLNCETVMYYGTMPSSFYMLNHPFAFITASSGCQRYFISTLNGCVTLKQLVWKHIT